MAARVTLGGVSPTVACLAAESDLVGLRTDAVLTLGEGFVRPEKGALAVLEIGGLKHWLQVEDFDLPRGKAGGRLVLKDAPSLVPRRRMDVFTAKGGVSFGEVLRRLAGPAKGPPALFGKKYPNLILDDMSVPELMEHVRSVHSDWSFQRGQDGLEVRSQARATLPVELDDIRDVPDGVSARISSRPIPAVGASVVGHGVQGVVLAATLTYVAGEGADCRLRIGTPGSAPARPPRSEFTVAATVKRRAPLTVEIMTDAGRVPVRARFMGRVTGGGKVREGLPLEVGDVGTAVIPVGGVSSETVRYYTYDEAKPTNGYELLAENRLDRVGVWKVEARQITQEADRVRTLADLVEALVQKFRINRK
jgi:hypothetical protein